MLAVKGVLVIAFALLLIAAVNEEPPLPTQTNLSLTAKLV